MLDDFRTAPIGEGLRATLALLEKMTLAPDDLTPADVDAVRAHGVTDLAIQDAMYVAYLFGIYNRVADTLGFHADYDAKTYGDMARILLLIGYR